MFKPKEIREVDNRGAVLSLGYEWVEVRDYLSDNLLWVAAALLFVAVAAMGFDAMTEHALSGLHDLAVLCLIGVPICALLYPRMKWKRRSLVFLSSGAIETPYGLPGHEKVLVVPGNHANILSIESTRRESGTYGVRIITRGGNLFYAASDLSEGAALHIAVQLSRSLQVFRGPVTSQLRPTVGQLHHLIH